MKPGLRTLDTKGLEMKHGNIVLLALAISTTGCAGKQPGMKVYMQECYGLVDQIMRIQATRKTRSQDMQEQTLAYAAGKLTDAEYARLSHHWLSTENSLATRVADLYTTAREKGCFEDITSE